MGTRGHRRGPSKDKFAATVASFGLVVSVIAGIFTLLGGVGIGFGGLGGAIGGGAFVKLALPAFITGLVAAVLGWMFKEMPLADPRAARRRNAVLCVVILIVAVATGLWVWGD